LQWRPFTAVEEVQVAVADNIQSETLPCLLLIMPKKNSDLKVGATVRLKAHSGEIIEGRVVHLWEEKSVPMVRVASGDMVYNVPARMLVDEPR
jgi:hypothetical protein